MRLGLFHKGEEGERGWREEGEKERRERGRREEGREREGANYFSTNNAMQKLSGLLVSLSVLPHSYIHPS